MSKCYSCLEDKKLKSNYCETCIKELFSGVVPKPLDFDRKEFYSQRKRLAGKMSISGVQDKISLSFENKELKPKESDGKYILKPIPLSSEYLDNKEDIIYNEHLSMLISKKVFSLNTAFCGIIKFNDGEDAYITKRFDYDEKTQLKYDQEDFASILQVTSSSHGADYKYNAKTYLDCARAIQNHVAASIPATEEFFKRVVLNYLISNGDAHLKNFSLYSAPKAKDYMLSPNYDILNTRYHVADSYTALDIFDEYTKEHEIYGYPTFADFKTLAKYLDIKDRRFEKIIETVKNSEEKVLKLVDKSFLSTEAKAFYIKSYKERIKMFFMTQENK
jgi:serine/threonine-protein kinase HipA